jgi:hypothetical protein
MTPFDPPLLPLRPPVQNSWISPAARSGPDTFFDGTGHVVACGPPHPLPPLPQGARGKESIVRGELSLTRADQSLVSGSVGRVTLFH